MINDREIGAIAQAVARRHIDRADLTRVVIEFATDSDGRDALRVVLVLDADAASLMTGTQALDILVDMQTALKAEGEDRFPIVEYATEDELRSDDDGGVISENIGRGD